MKAMIFAAGLGTRLKPLTNDRPKALVEVNGVTMLELAILKLKNAGVDQIIINLHHFADKIREFVKIKNSFGVEIVFSDESELLLDTGGGLKKARWFLDDGAPFFIYNVDILTNLDLKTMWDAHSSSKALATLAIKERPGHRFFLFDKDNRMCGWKNFATQEEKISLKTIDELYPIAFSCIHVIQPSIFDLIEEEGVFSIIDVYLRLAKKHLIYGYNHDKDIWMDMGKPDKVLEGGEMLRNLGMDGFI